MTQDELNDIADELDSKAQDVEDGGYGDSEPGEDESWSGDLKHAAYLLREGRTEDLNQSELEEIEAIGYDPDALNDLGNCEHGVIRASCDKCRQPQPAAGE